MLRDTVSHAVLAVWAAGKLRCKPSSVLSQVYRAGTV